MIGPSDYSGSSENHSFRSAGLEKLVDTAIHFRSGNWNLAPVKDEQSDYYSTGIKPDFELQKHLTDLLA